MMLKLCGGWRGKRASSIAYLAPVFACRSVLMKKALFDASSLLRIVKCLTVFCHPHLVRPHALQNNTV